MHKLIRISSVLLIICNFVFADNWYSIHRFSLNLSYNGYYNPLKDYNNAVEKQAEAVMYNPRYISPKGNYEKIYGDMGFDVGIKYQISDKFKIGYTYSDNNCTGDFEFYPTEVVIHPDYEYYLGIAYQQDINLSIQSHNINLNYEIYKIQKISINATTGLLFIKSDLGFDWNYDRIHDEGPINLEDDLYINIFRKNISETTFGFAGGLEFDYKLSKHLSIFTNISYRFAEFDKFESEKKFDPLLYEDIYYKLIKSDSYFGIKEYRASRLEDYESSIYSPDFVSYGNYENASINISSFGVKIGINIGF